MVAVSGMDVGKEFISILGLPKETSFLQLTIGAGAVVEVMCHCYPDAAALAQVQAVMQRYHLVLIEETPVSSKAQLAQEQTLQALERLKRIREDLLAVLNMETLSRDVREALTALGESAVVQRLVHGSLGGTKEYPV